MAPFERISICDLGRSSQPQRAFVQTMSLPEQSMPMGLHQHDQYTTYFEVAAINLPKTMNGRVNNHL
jgi:hypothetical protein